MGSTAPVTRPLFRARNASSKRSQASTSIFGPNSRRAASSLNAPRALADYGFTEDSVAEAAEAILPSVPPANPRPVTAADLRALLRAAWSGADPATGKVPEDLDAQCAAMFANVKRVIETTGGTTDDIIKMNVWITDRALRPIMNKYWVEMFPDPHSRPARHTIASGDFTPPMQIQCDLMAVIGD